MPISGRRGRQAHRRILHLTAIWRHILRDGQGWLCRTVGSILAGASLPVIKDPKWRDKALAIEFWIATLVVGGAFVAGLYAAAKQLFD